ncbi:MAG: hypothetical protein WBB07_22875 [Mycobacterium sp.]
MRAQRCALRTTSALLAVGAVVLPAAVASAEPAPEDSSTPVITMVPEVPPSPGQTQFTDDPAIVDRHAQNIESWSRLPDPDTIAVQFTTGTPQCFGAHAEVQETADIVAIKLSTGTLPEATNRACVAIAVFATLTVTLDAPVGHRAVVSIV